MWMYPVYCQPLLFTRPQSMIKIIFKARDLEKCPLPPARTYAKFQQQIVQTLPRN